MPESYESYRLRALEAERRSLQADLVKYIKLAYKDGNIDSTSYTNLMKQPSVQDMALGLISDLYHKIDILKLKLSEKDN